MTTVWMLAVLTALVCWLGALAAGWLTRFWPDLEGLRALTGILNFAGLVVGTMVLALTVLVLRRRPVAPPRPITWFAVAAGLAPWISAILRAALG